MRNGRGTRSEITLWSKIVSGDPKLAMCCFATRLPRHASWSSTLYKIASPVPNDEFISDVAETDHAGQRVVRAAPDNSCLSSSPQSATLMAFLPSELLEGVDVEALEAITAELWYGRKFLRFVAELVNYPEETVRLEQDFFFRWED